MAPTSGVASATAKLQFSFNLVDKFQGQKFHVYKQPVGTPGGLKLIYHRARARKLARKRGGIFQHVVYARHCVLLHNQ